ncbi:BamA/TamA family outer membrane protein [Pseudohalioglobus sediminis]|uniref:BamA/TamA family outer membrane protein n=1 Tax=Pseudohalioglobus sediminis TaxID=2606449 RepID=UPI00165FF370|nr:BamA/TamA family outer membrane protein [Pseudohalioglobus sediminis]
MLACMLAIPAAAQECQEVPPQQPSDSFRFESSPEHRSFAESLPDGLIISSITITRYRVFDREDPRENAGIYRWANDFHSLTREWVIREQLLVKEGDYYLATMVRESERVLRDLKFLYDARVRPWRRCGEYVDLEVITRDIWTFTPTVNFKRSGGTNEYSLGFRDTNFLGTGKQVAVRYDSDEERSGTTLIYDDPAVAGSRWRTRLSLTDNDDGHDYRFRLNRPFFSVYERWSAGMRLEDWEREENIWFRGDEVEEFDHQQQSVRFFGGVATERELEKQVGRWLLGYHYENNEFAFSDSEIPPPELPEDREYSFPFIGYQSIEDEYMEIHNLNYLGRTEDLYVGEHYLWNLGYSAEALGATRDQVHFSGRYGNTLRVTDRDLWLVDSEITGFWSTDDAEFENMWLTINSRYHWRQAAKWALFSGIRLDYTDGLTGDNQLTLGGQNGLRGYERNYQVGDRSAVFNIEQRYYSDWHPFRLLRVGYAVFFDVGRAWFEGEDNGSNGGVLSNAGIGIRLNSSRAEKGSVIHIDLAFPFNKDDDVDDVQLLMTVKDRF